jgi:hypothetical protein
MLRRARLVEKVERMDLRSPGEWLLDRVSFSKCNTRVKLHTLRRRVNQARDRGARELNRSKGDRMVGQGRQH